MAPIVNFDHVTFLIQSYWLLVGVARRQDRLLNNNLYATTRAMIVTINALTTTMQIKQIDCKGRLEYRVVFSVAQTSYVSCLLSAANGEICLRVSISVPSKLCSKNSLKELYTGQSVIAVTANVELW